VSILSLPGLVETLTKGAGAAREVLDLGSVSPESVQFFGGRGSRLTIADLSPTASDLTIPCADPGAPFDLVLAWDVLNYLGPEKLGRLMEQLEPRFRPGTTLHALIATGREIDAYPPRYRIRGAGTFIAETASGPRLRAPRYLEGDLVKRMPGLTVERRYQLRSEMLEYVFSYRPLSAGSVGGADWMEPRTLPMKSGRPSPIQRTTTTRSFSQSM
jgi:hypothetical protein